MNQTNQLWLIEVSSQNGKLLATKNQLAKSAVTSKLEADECKGTVAVVHIKRDAVLQTALVTTKGELPVGVLPAIDDDSASEGMNTSQILWVNLGFSKSKHVSQRSRNTSEKATTSNLNQNSDGFMTEKQRRYLFRLLAERNITGKQAESYLKKALNTFDLTKASKAAASELIDKLVTKGDSHVGSY